jgi:hypothetical protein
MDEVKRITSDVHFGIDEREVNLIYTEKDDKWVVETSVRKWNTKFKKQGWKLLEEVTDSEGHWISSVYEAPSFSVIIGSTIKKARVLSDEEKERRRERMMILRQKQ